MHEAKDTSGRLKAVRIAVAVGGLVSSTTAGVVFVADRWSAAARVLLLVCWFCCLVLAMLAPRGQRKLQFLWLVPFSAVLVGVFLLFQRG